MDPMAQHPAGRSRRVLAGQKVAAMMALKVTGDTASSSELLMDFADTAELTLGFQAVIEQLAVELAIVRQQTPQEVLADIAVMCASMLAHPDPRPPDVVD